jgi:hypothetical protein
MFLQSLDKSSSASVTLLTSVKTDSTYMSGLYMSPNSGQKGIKEPCDHTVRTETEKYQFCPYLYQFIQAFTSKPHQFHTASGSDSICFRFRFRSICLSFRFIQLHTVSDF